MISERMFRDALIAAGAKRVSPAALKAFNAWMIKFMDEEAAKAVTRMNAQKRVTVERRDIGE
jgi:histone H3/H4